MGGGESQRRKGYARENAVLWEPPMTNEGGLAEAASPVAGNDATTSRNQLH